MSVDALELLQRQIDYLSRVVDDLKAHEHYQGVMLTNDHGLAVLMVAGENLSRGNGVYPRQAGGADGQVWKTPTSGDMCCGIVYQDALAGAGVWVVTSGIAYVLPTSGVTAVRGYVLYSSATEAGRADQSATVPATTVHFTEWGHWIEGSSGAGALARAFIHFN